jgi:hypothetical protein
MTLILSGTDGLSDVDGSAATPAIRGTDANTGIFFPAADQVAITTGGTQRCVVDASGNVGVGTASPSGKLDVQGGRSWFASNNDAFSVYLRYNNSTNGVFLGSPSAGAFQISGPGGNALVNMDSSGNVGIGTSSPATKLDVSGPASVTSFTGTTKLGVTTRGSTGATDYSGIDFIGGNQTNPVARIAALTTGGGSTLSFGTSNNYASGITNTAMTIDSSGNLLVGTTSALYSGGISVVSSGQLVSVRSSSATAGKKWQAPYIDTSNKLYIVNQDSVGVSIADGATAWSAYSDERLKDIIEPISNAAEKVCSLRAVIGKYKTDADGTRRSLLIAQDVEAVLPEAISKSKIPQSEDTTEYLNVAYTDVIPLLVAAIKEQSQLITTLTDRITALETPTGTQA